MRNLSYEHVEDSLNRGLDFLVKLVRSGMFLSPRERFGITAAIHSSYHVKLFAECVCCSTFSIASSRETPLKSAASIQAWPADTLQQVFVCPVKATRGPADYDKSSEFAATKELEPYSCFDSWENPVDLCEPAEITELLLFGSDKVIFAFCARYTDEKIEQGIRQTLAARAFVAMRRQKWIISMAILRLFITRKIEHETVDDLILAAMLQQSFDGLFTYMDPFITNTVEQRAVLGLQILNTSAAVQTLSMLLDGRIGLA